MNKLKFVILTNYPNLKYSSQFNPNSENIFSLIQEDLICRVSFDQSVVSGTPGLEYRKPFEVTQMRESLFLICLPIDIEPVLNTLIKIYFLSCEIVMYCISLSLTLTRHPKRGCRKELHWLEKVLQKEPTPLRLRE